MKCEDCKYRITQWERSGWLSITATNTVKHTYCNNPKSEHYGKEIVRMDECNEAEE